MDYVETPADYVQRGVLLALICVFAAVAVFLMISDMRETRYTLRVIGRKANDATPNVDKPEPTRES